MTVPPKDKSPRWNEDCTYDPGTVSFDFFQPSSIAKILAFPALIPSLGRPMTFCVTKLVKEIDTHAQSNSPIWKTFPGPTRSFTVTKAIRDRTATFPSVIAVTLSSSLLKNYQ